jgi:hypothetical protein
MQWSVVPGLALIAAGLVIQFGTYRRQPRSFGLAFRGIQLRFVGIGVLFLGIGLDLVISALFSGFQIGRILLGLVMIGFASL